MTTTEEMFEVSVNALDEALVLFKGALLKHIDSADAAEKKADTNEEPLEKKLEKLAATVAELQEAVKAKAKAAPGDDEEKMPPWMKGKGKAKAKKDEESDAKPAEKVEDTQDIEKAAAPASWPRDMTKAVPREGVAKSEDDWGKDPWATAE